MSKYKPYILENLRDKLTPGPWAYIGQGWIVHPGTKYTSVGTPIRTTCLPASDADALFMVAAPDLYDRLRAAEKVAEAAQKLDIGITKIAGALSPELMRQLEGLRTALTEWENAR